MKSPAVMEQGVSVKFKMSIGDNRTNTTIDLWTIPFLLFCRYVVASCELPGCYADFRCVSLSALTQPWHATRSDPEYETQNVLLAHSSVESNGG